MALENVYFSPFWTCLINKFNRGLSKISQFLKTSQSSMPWTIFFFAPTWKSWFWLKSALEWVVNPAFFHHLDRTSVGCASWSTMKRSIGLTQRLWNSTREGLLVSTSSERSDAFIRSHERVPSYTLFILCTCVHDLSHRHQWWHLPRISW